jgi:hypothetical protein
MKCGYFDEKCVEQLKGKQILSGFPVYVYIRYILQLNKLTCYFHQLCIRIVPTMASQAIIVVTVKLFFGMAKGMELCMEEELLHITNVVRGEKFSSPHTNLVLNRWPL